MSWNDGVVGRADELDVAAGAVASLVAGRASALVIEGEAGIGKSCLVQAIEHDARSRQVAVFRGQAHPFERARPFGLVTAALDLRTGSHDPRRAAVGAMLTRDPQETEPVAGDLQYRVLDMVVDIVEASSADRPALLVAEDIHWADPSSLAAISAIVRRTPYSPTLVVVTVRASPRSAEVSRLLEDLAAQGARTLRLSPLPPEDILALATLRLGEPPGPALTAMLVKAGGNPLLATALLRSMEDAGILVRGSGGVEATSSELPTSLSELVLRRLRDVPPATIELLQMAAVLGDAVSIRDLAAVAQQSPVKVANLLGEAFEAQLLDESEDRVVFRHQLVHDAIYQHIPAPTRHVLHREAAVALMAAGASRLDVADHLVMGAERGDDEAVGWLRDAAREAASGAPPVSVELLRRAEALLPGGHPDIDEVSTEVVEALLRAGQVVEASRRAEAMLARSHPAPVDTRLRMALLGALALQNRADEVIAVAQAFLTGPPHVGAVAEVPVLAQLSWALTYSGEPAAGESAARRALVVADNAGIGAFTVLARTALLVALGRQGRFGEALVEARRAAALAGGAPGHELLPLQPQLFLGLALFDCDLVEEARAAYRNALDESLGSGWWLADTLMADAAACFELGEWADAGPRLAAAADAAREKQHSLLLSHSLAHQTVIATGAGDLVAAQQLASEIAWALEGEQPGYNAGMVAFALGGLRAAQGEHEAAYELLLRCWRYDVKHGIAFYHRRLAPDLVRLALASDRPAVAAEVADDVAEEAALAPDVPTVNSVALRCAGLVSGDAEPVLEAVALGRESRLLLPHAGACEDAATLLARSGCTDDASALLAEALDLFEQAGADAWAARVRARMRSLGAHLGARGSRTRPATGWESLTTTERAVSVLVAEGLTNGAVARQLYVSPHTVNTHLRHVFAKLGVSNRVELAGVVHRSIE